MVEFTSDDPDLAATMPAVLKKTASPEHVSKIFIERYKMFGIGLPELIILIVMVAIFVIPILIVIWIIKRVKRKS